MKSVVPLLSILLLSPSRQEAWKPAQAPLMTRWAKDVSPEKVLPEYPRPQMVRAEWRSLNGLWEYAITGKDDAAPKAYAGKILVPFAIESALSGVMKRVDEKSRLWYRREVEIPKSWAGKRLLLHFGAVDWESTVFVNGKDIGSHRGGYDGFSFDVTPALRDGIQEVVVSVFDATGGFQPRGKQARKPSGIFYTPTTGIWQTVWMEPVPDSRIDGLTMTPDLDAGALKLTVHAAGEVEAVAKSEGKEVGRVKGKGGDVLALPVPDAKLWSPEHPFLYDLEVSLLKDRAAIDSISSYFGMRKIALGKDEKGITRPYLNGKFVFQTGPLDQGYWPDGILTAPTDEALRYDVEMAKKLGFNATRKHVKVEPERWYFWCDRLGLLVWQDMPSGDATPPKGKLEIERSADSGKAFEQELQAMIDGRRNHPSIILWVVYNEAWGQWETERMTKWVKEHDPSRLVDCASGWHDFPVGDVHDAHVYPGPGSPKPEASRAAVLGEFGGLGLGIDGHTWSAKTWGYKGVADGAELTDKYVSLLRKVRELEADPGLSAAIYTQLTDVETECNGLLTYDRERIKVDVEKVSAANRGRP